MTPGPEGYDRSAPLVRPAALADAAAVFALADMLAISFPIDRAGFDRTYPDVLDATGTQLLVAEVDGRVGGYLLGFVHPTFYANRPVAWVEELAVLPDDRRRGLGSQLMHEFEDRARVDGARLVALATTRAAAFYQSIGYERRADYFRKTVIDQEAWCARSTRPRSSSPAQRYMRQAAPRTRQDRPLTLFVQVRGRFSWSP